MVGRNRKSHPRSLSQRRLQDPTHHGGWRAAGSEHPRRCGVTPCSTRSSPGHGQWPAEPCSSNPQRPGSVSSQAQGSPRALVQLAGTRGSCPPGLSIAVTSVGAGAGPGRTSALLGRATASAPSRHGTAAKPSLLSRTFANPAGFDVRGCPREAHKGRFQGCSAKRWRTPAGKGRRRGPVSLPEVTGAEPGGRAARNVRDPAAKRSSRGRPRVGRGDMRTPRSCAGVTAPAEPGVVARTRSLCAGCPGGSGEGVAQRRGISPAFFSTKLLGLCN